MQSLSVLKYIADTTESPLFSSFLGAERLTNETSKIILQQIVERWIVGRVDDPSLLPFVRFMLVFINFMSRSDLFRFKPGDIQLAVTFHVIRYTHQC